MKWLAIALVLAATPALAQSSEPESRVMCTSVGGPIFIGKDWPVSVPLKCCPAGSFIDEPKNPALDKQGNLICYKEKT